MFKPVLIVIDGTDGSGKQTQTEMLCDWLKNQDLKVRHLSFPRYDNGSSYFVRRYLSGSYGQNADMEDPRSASLYYALDRADLFKSEEFDEDIIVCDRYTTSNMIHQAAKIKDKNEKEAFVEWLEDLEYGILEIPKPDAVFFLDVPPEISGGLVAERVRDGGPEPDIHEKDESYEARAYATARDLSERLRWERVECVRDGELRSPESIAGEIRDRLDPLVTGIRKSRGV